MYSVHILGHGLMVTCIIIDMPFVMQDDLSEQVKVTEHV